MIVAGAAVVVVSEPTRDVSLALVGAAVVVVSEPTRNVSLALDGAEPVAVGAALVPAGAVRRRWANRRWARTGRRWARGHWGQT